jgi:pyruvate/2-oxoglutarate dehydrogenase complex dihydrolipoamide acyltransferase (E2) component
MLRQFVFLLFLCGSCAGSALAQDSAKDLFFKHEEKPPANTPSRGRPGLKISVELKRGNHKPVFVSPDYDFRSGDAIRLHVSLNFRGYLTVINEGSSGKSQLLYPRPGLHREYPRVSLEEGFSLPNKRSKDWIYFDQTPGQEKLQILLSEQPLPDVQQFLAQAYQATQSGYTGSSSAPAQPAAQPQPAPVGNAAQTTTVAVAQTAQQEEEIIASLRGVGSKDLMIKREADATYAVPASASAPLKQPIAISLALAHR